MYARLGENWTVAQMACEAHMSERNFRLAFAAVTRQSPKRFYDRLRLRTAEELLRQGVYTVAQVGDRLGFSSPFHFSKAFKQCFGYPPSKAK